MQVKLNSPLRQKYLEICCTEYLLHGTSDDDRGLEIDSILEYIHGEGGKDLLQYWQTRYGVKILLQENQDQSRHLVIMRRKSRFLFSTLMFYLNR